MINLENINLNYKDTKALKDITIEFPEHGICGLLGRNGAGKTSLLSLLSGYRQATSGRLTVNGQKLYENPDVLPRIAYIYNNQKDVVGDYRVKDLIHITEVLRPNWDSSFANRLIKLFGIPLKKTMSSLSQGQKAAVHVTIGLAGQTPITLYDEAYLGMDAAMRKLFISELLEDYMQRPKLILFSTHYINEIENTFSDVLILHEGQMLAYDDCDTLRQKGTVITGNAEAVDLFIKDKEMLSERTLGNQKEVVFYCELTEKERLSATNARLTISHPSLEDLFIYLTGKEGE